MKTNDKKPSLTEKSLILHLICTFLSYLSVCSSKCLASRKARQSVFEKASVSDSKFASAVSKAGAGISAFKKAAAAQFSSSAVMSILKKVRITALKTSLRSYGTGLFFFGLYSVLISAMRHYLSDRAYFEDSAVFTGIICIAASLLLLSSSKPIADMLCNSNSFGPVVTNVFCLRADDVLEDKRKYNVFNIPLLIGTVLGLLTFFVSPLGILYGLAQIILLAILIISPEFGVNGLIIILPFVPERTHTAIIALIFFAYILKMIRGKRKFIFDLSEFFVLALGVIGIIRCALGYERSPVAFGFVISLPLLYFSVRNMFSSKKLICSLSDILGASFFIIVFARMLYCIFVKTGVSLNLFSAVDGIGDPYAIGEYAVISIGFALLSASRAGFSLRKIVLSIAISACVTVFAAMGKPEFIIAACAGILTYAVISRQKSALFCVPIIAIPPIAYILFSGKKAVSAIAGMFTVCTEKSAGILYTDFLFIFGISGAVLLLMFITVRVTRFTANTGTMYDEGKRSVCAAYVSSFVSALIYCMTVKGGLHPASVLFLITVAALSSSLQKEHSITLKERKL